MSTETVLVTGGCGYVGSHLCELLLSRGDRVVVLDNLSVGAAENLSAGIREEVSVATVDLRDTDALRKHLAVIKPDSVVHLAAIHYIPLCDQDPAGAVSVNAQGTQSLFDAIKDNESVRAVVVASTGAVYRPSMEAHAEDSAIGPTDIYGLTKLWTEQIAQLASTKTDIAIAVARMFNVFGPGETNPHLIPEVLRQLEDGGRIRLGDLSTRRDYVHVRDIGRGLIRLLEVSQSASRPLVFNFGSERDVDGHTLIALIERATGRSIEIEFDQSRLRRSPDRPRLCSDCSAAKEMLGWTAQITLEEGVAETLGRPLAASARSAAATG